MEKSGNGGRALADMFSEEKTSEEKQQREAEEDPEGIVPESVPPPSVDKEIVPHHVPEIHQHGHHHHAHGSVVQHRHEKRFLDFLKAHPSKDWFQKLGIVRRLSPFSFLRKSNNNNAQPPPAPPATTTATHAATVAGHRQDNQRSSSRRRGFRVSFVRKINWAALWLYGKDWVRRPANFALFLWLIACGIALFILLLLILGALNGAITNATTRRDWVEGVNQVLNGLFTIMCLYQHPRIIHHLIMFVRWTDRDAAGLRVLYCRYTDPRPKERARLLFVLALLHITCFAQYSLCVLFWVYNRHNRPDLGQILCIGVGIVAPVVAAVYTLYGPLAKKEDSSSSTTDDEESPAAVAAADDGRVEEMGEMEVRVTSETVTPNGGKLIVTQPEWVGGLFDGLMDDGPVAGLSFFCTFCVFGWNMERLGFGSMYVHVATFLLLCFAPFWVFAVTGLKIDDDGVTAAVWIVGLVLSFLGMLYGGFWRTRMRRRFGLPADRDTCFGYAAIADCAKWLFCWTCALAQEVRTANFYDIEQDSFYSKQDRTAAGANSSSDNGGSSPLALLSRGGGGSEKLFVVEAAVIELERNKQSLSGEDYADPLSVPMPTVIQAPVANGRR